MGYKLPTGDLWPVFLFGGVCLIDDLTPIIVGLPFGNDVKVYPIGDMHYGSPQFMEEEWKAFSKRLLKEKNSYVVLVGDLIDNGLKNSKTCVYEETCRPYEQKEWLVRQLDPIKDKILCGVSGNHETRSRKESDSLPIYDVFARLGIEDRFRENMAFLFLRIGDANQNIAGQNRSTYVMCVTHGSGGGSYVSSGGPRMENFGNTIDGVDAIITGHTHKPMAYPVGKLKVDTSNKKITQSKFWVIRATSWMKYGGYAAQKMLSPSTFCLSEIRLAARKKDIRVTQ